MRSCRTGLAAIPAWAINQPSLPRAIGCLGSSFNTASYNFKAPSTSPLLTSWLACAIRGSTPPPWPPLPWPPLPWLPAPVPVVCWLPVSVWPGSREPLDAVTAQPASEPTARTRAATAASRHRPRLRSAGVRPGPWAAGAEAVAEAAVAEAAVAEAAVVDAAGRDFRRGGALRASIARRTLAVLTV